MQIFLYLTNLYQKFNKSFGKITAFFILMLKIILLIFSFTKTYNNVIGTNCNEIASINIFNGDIFSEKVKNLSNAKNIKKLAKIKRPDFIKANKSSKTTFL